MPPSFDTMSLHQLATWCVENNGNFGTTFDLGDLPDIDELEGGEAAEVREAWRAAADSIFYGA